MPIRASEPPPLIWKNSDFLNMCVIASYLTRSGAGLDARASVLVVTEALALGGPDSCSTHRSPGRLFAEIELVQS